jgi:branched-chain amino acid transport system ATP-binding protein
VTALRERMPALDVRELRLSFGSVPVLADVGFTVDAGEVFAVIGPNGAGKTSLFNVLSRVYRPDAGSLRFHGDDLLRRRAHELAAIGIARTFQNLGLFGQMSALENVLVGRHHLMRTGPLRGGIWLGPARAEEKRHRAVALQALEFTGIAEFAERPAGKLPYALRKRVEIARALAMEPRLLLLDEPVAGMSGAERAEMTELIRRVHRERELSIVLVEHDMGMVMQVAQRVMVLDFGRVIACGRPGEIQRDPHVVAAYLGEPMERAA